MSQTKPTPDPSRKPPAPISRRKLWIFRLLALVGVPLLGLVLLEVGLRLAGFGYPTGFLLKSTNHGTATFVQNNRFGWRFFGARASRQPEATSIPRVKDANTIRVFVFGESAAYGDPQPRFGLPRMLEAMLSLRHPDKKFEVVNAAMTGINSHVILPLARDCAKAQGDVWVIYMGNNEVVGPFGAGTVFGNQTTPLPLIRSGLALKATDVGQLLDRVRNAAEKTAATGDWEGMRMFVKYKIAASDPRLAAVYNNFDRNLRDIIAAGQGSGAKIVLSTVGVNLAECAPFASLHRSGLSPEQLDDWLRAFDTGESAREKGDFAGAFASFEQAAKIDDTYAELRFRRGQCALGVKDVVLARKEFSAARDLDALRFRCDTRLNEIMRGRAVGGVELADGEGALARESRDGIAGGELFYEHVHLTLEGNYVLAREIAEKVERALPLSSTANWPEIAQCAQSLGHTSRDTQLALSDMLGRLADEPFVFQASHGEDIGRLTDAARRLPPANSGESLQSAQLAAEAALTHWTNDGPLWQQLGEIKQVEGDTAGALAAAQHSLDALPSNSQGWLLSGILLAQTQKYDEASRSFTNVFALDPQAVWARNNYALCLDKMGRHDEAIAQFKSMLALKPSYGTGWLALGQVYEKMGRTNDAEHCYSVALTNRVNQADDLATLARFCVSRGWNDQAVTNFVSAIVLSPSDPALRLEAGQVLSTLGRHEEAAMQFAAEVELVPDGLQGHLQLGTELGRLGLAARAEPEFRQALRLDPDSLPARLDLGIALYQQQKFEESRKMMDQVLQHMPNNATALRYVELLRKQAAKSSP